MSEWQVIWLGTMAVALVVMAVMQIAVLIAAMRLGREILQTSQELRREIKPLIEKVHRVSDDAGKVAALALTQVEQLDTMLKSTAVRIDETITLVQGAVLEPVRQGAALFGAIRAFAAGLRGAGERATHARDDEDALFVG